jgi:hypothetical protein
MTEKSKILDIVKHHLYADEKEYQSIAEMFQPLVIAQCSVDGCEDVAALLFDIFHEFQFVETPLVGWKVGDFLGPEDGSYAFCYSHSGHVSVYTSLYHPKDEYSGIKVEGFTTEWRAAQVAKQYGYQVGYTGGGTGSIPASLEQAEHKNPISSKSWSFGSKNHGRG